MVVRLKDRITTTRDMASRTAGVITVNTGSHQMNVNNSNAKTAICDYCYEEYMEKNEYDQAYYNGQISSSDKKKEQNNILQFNSDNNKKYSGSYQKLSCVYCASRHSISDISCVKNLKSFGFIPPKGTNKIQISSLSKEKIKKLENLRVIQKTLVYVIGIAPEIAQEEILKAPEYFGQYGDLTKVVVNTNNVYNATRGGPSYSAYLTYSHPRESAIAILSVDQHQLHDRVLRASFGTSKFCQFFMNGQKCTNKDCLYLHEIKCDLEAYTKEDMQNNKFIFQEQQKIAIKLSRALEFTLEEFRDYNRANNKNLPPENVKFDPKLPSPDTIYYKDFHFLDEPLINRKHIRDGTMVENQQNSDKKDSEESSNTPTNKSSNNSGHQNSQSLDQNKSSQSTLTTNANNMINSSSAITNGLQQSLSVGAVISNSSAQNIMSMKENVSANQNIAKENQSSTVTDKDITPLSMTLSNQKDLNNQSDRNQSQTRIKTNNTKQSNQNNNNNSNNNGTTSKSQKHNNIATPKTTSSKTTAQVPTQEDQNQSNAQDREEAKAKVQQQDEEEASLKRQEQIIEDIIDDCNNKRQQQQNNESSSTAASKKSSTNFKSLSLESQPLVDSTASQLHNVQTPRETTVLTSTRKIFDLSAQHAKPLHKDNLLETILVQDNNLVSAPTLTKQSSYQGGFSSLDQLVLAQVNNKKSEVSTLSKTPPHHDNQLMMQISQLLSPMLFSKKQQSRFQFAHSVDPIKTGADDWDEIEVPAKIQDLIERNIRTLSNSQSNKGDLNYQEVAFGIKDLQEKWLTKQEKLLECDDNNQLRNRKNDGNDISSVEDNNRMLKYKQKKVDPNNNNAQDSKQYNLTEHSQNIRVKINRQNSKDNLDIENNKNDKTQNVATFANSTNLNGQVDDQQQVNIDNSSSSATIEDAKSSSRASSLVQQKSSSYSSYGQNNGYGYNYNNKQQQQMKGRRRKEEKRSDIHNNIGYNKGRKLVE